MSQPTSSPASSARSGDIPCPECGEAVRPGLVRCWNCGAFMKPSIEKKFLEMQAQPKKIFFSPLPEDADIHAMPVDAEAADEDVDEDDFVLTSQGGASPSEGFGGGMLESAAPSADAAKPKAGAPAGEESTGPAHSVATGGDVLLAIALKEELETTQRRRKTRKVTGGARTAHGFLVFCPYGCKIEVKDQHRGMTGRCPRCRAPFLVPVDPPDYSVKGKEDSGAAAAAAAAPGGYQVWMQDVHLHIVNPLKLKLKADSLLKGFTEYDLAVSEKDLLLVNLAKKAGGLFGGGGGDKKKPEIREALRAQLRDNKTFEELAVGDKKKYSPDDVRTLRVVQPAPSRTESMFHGIAVFGAHRIAVQLPAPEQGDLQFLSFGLTEFREFSKALASLLKIEGFGAGLGIPLEDKTAPPVKCHYTDARISALQDVEWYKADPKSNVVLAGWKCGSCGIVVSEDARKKEKIGGATPKGLAKAMCPKCKKKFGEQPLYSLPQAAPAASMSGTEAGEPAAAAGAG